MWENTQKVRTNTERNADNNEKILSRNEGALWKVGVDGGVPMVNLTLRICSFCNYLYFNWLQTQYMFSLNVFLKFQNKVSNHLS